MLTDEWTYPHVLYIGKSRPSGQEIAQAVFFYKIKPVSPL